MPYLFDINEVVLKEANEYTGFPVDSFEMLPALRDWHVCRKCTVIYNTM